VKDVLLAIGALVIGAGVGLTMGDGPHRRVRVFVTAMILGAIWGLALNVR
jgi:hypothetical protein